MGILEKLKQPLPINDVDFRIQAVNKGGYAKILAYKDARVDMNRLDEVCGTNWQKDYKTIDGSLYCGIGVKIENEWLWRWDVGTESFSDKEKGKASDAFKRAGFCWGIGRELYDYPPIRIKLKAAEFSVFNNDRGETSHTTYNLRLKDWKWNVEFNTKNEVSRLTAFDDKGIRRYHYEVGKTTGLRPSDLNGSSSAGEMPWLNKKDEEGNFTRAWLNVVNAIGEGKVTSTEQVKSHFRLSKTIAEEIQKTINLTTINQ